jgi:Zn-dependent protease with chaperone function
MRTILLAVALLVLAWPSSARAESARDKAFEDQLVNELRARSPEAVEVFLRANTARAAGDLTTASTLYGQVHDLAPWFVAALRRRCGVETELHDYAGAIAYCRDAVAAERSPLNLIALATALAATGTASDGREARSLSEEATAAVPDDPFVAQGACGVAFALRDEAKLEPCSRTLERLAPDEPWTHYILMLAALQRNDMKGAVAELDEAHARGLPDAQYRELRAKLDAARSPLDRYGRPLLWLLGAWLAGFLALFVVGSALSGATMRAVSKGTFSSGHARGGEGLLRRTYAATLAVTSAYFYVSIPFVALVVVGGFGGFILLCLEAGQVPIKLVLLGGLFILVTLSSMAKSLFHRVRDAEPGRKLDLATEPKLRAVLDEVAGKIDTRPVDTVYLTPGVEVSVFERGGGLSRAAGLGKKSERCLVLGAAVLEGMSLRQFKSILGHEYGHFRNADTAGGGFALRVRRSIALMAIHMIQGRAAHPLNPAWWFIRAFQATFLRVSQGASRLQEVLADRWAAAAYGPDAFVGGLTHVVERGVRFDTHLSATVNEAVKQQRPVANLYEYRPEDGGDPAKIGEAIAKAMSGPSSPNDSHPKPAQRIELVAQLASAAPAADVNANEDDVVDAWSLLSQRKVVEEWMTEAVRSTLANRGVRLPKPVASAAQ